MIAFPFTPEGYLLAKAWLIKVGEWDRVSTTGQSVDGWSIVHAANILFQEKNKTT